MTNRPHTWAAHLAAAACALAYVLCACLCTPPRSWAASDTYTVVVQGTSGEHSLEAYQVFSGSVSTNSALVFQLSNPGWGSGVSAAGQEALGSATEQFAWVDADPATARAFAEELVSSGWLDPTAAVRGVYNNDTGCYILHHLEPGWYLIKDADTDDAGATQEEFAFIPYLTAVAGNVDINAQATAPLLVKKFFEPQGSVGRTDVTVTPSSTITVELAATLPPNLEAYNSYELVFSDELPPGASIDDTSIALAIGQEALASDDYTVQLTPAGALVVALADLQTLKAAPGNGDTVRLTYQMTCENTQDAMPTQAALTYSNNPNPGGSSSRGTTAPATASLTVREPPEPAAEPVATTASSAPTVPCGILVAALGACVLAVAAVVGVVTRKHEV